jgi:LSD1 subclass zinc finger protein
VSDLVACPTCGSTLRLPPTAATVRCPKCKTLLEVSGPTAPSPPPPAPPKPLPFAPAPAPVPPPAVASPVKKPKARAKPVGKRRHRPELVDEELETEQERVKAAKAEAERKRQVRDELEQIERKEEKEDDRYDEVDEECGWGRSALQTLRWSLLGYICGMALGYVVLLPMVAIGWIFQDRQFLSSIGVALPAFSLVVTFGSLLGTAVGFVLAIRGPRGARHIPIMGLVVVGLQLLFVCGTIPRAVTAADEYARTPETFEGYPGMEIAYLLVGTTTNLQTVTDSPVRLAFSLRYGGYEVPWLNVVCGLFEFTRLVLLCMLVQRYGELAKSERTAGESPKTVTRVFFTLVVFALFRGAACIGFDWFQYQDGGVWWYVGQLVHLNIFFWAFIIIGVRLLTQFRVIGETEDLLIADRVASKYDTFNEV